MVYKRYIKRGGKIYGPYEYHSEKKDGKVVSVYLGKPEGAGKKPKKYFFILAAIFGLLILSGIFFIDFSLTGKAVLDLQKTYFVGDKIDGSVKLILKQGELIPSDVKVFIDNGGEYSEYLLNELLSITPAEGNFYVEGKNISGSGLGYGFAGEKKIYPEFSFLMKITSSGSEEEVSEETITPEFNESVDETINETEIPTTEQENNLTTELLPPAPEENETENQITSEENPVEEVTEPTEQTEILEVTTEETETPTTEEQGESEPAPITGYGILGENVITGKISADKPYYYELSEGESAEIVSSEHDVKIKIKNNVVEVTTDYYENEKGFGEGYITGATGELKIDLSLLGIVVNEGVFIFKLLAGGEEIVSIEQEIALEEINKTELNISESNKSNEETIQYGAVLGKPVKWKKTVWAENSTDLSVEIPKTATNITVYKIEKKESSEGEENNEIEELETDEETISELNETEVSEVINETGQTTNLTTEEINETEEIEQSRTEVADGGAIITGEVISNLEGSGFFNKIFGSITGRVVDISESEEMIEILITGNNATEYEIEYETPGAVAFESETEIGKEIVISSDIHYENVLAYTQLPYGVSLEKINLYWVVNGSRVAVDFVAYDFYGEVVVQLNLFTSQTTLPINETENESINENKTIIYGEEANETINETEFSIKDIINETKVEGEINISLVNYITWVVPHLSNQTYELIIEITKAEHLDENRTFISDIYEEVRALDGGWSEVIGEGHYVRVAFEENLTNKNDITIYARAVSGEPDIEVYADDCEGSVLIDSNNVSKEIYAKKKRIDEIRRLLNE